MSAAIRQALEAGAVCFDTREHWLAGSRALDHKHGHLTPHIVVEPTSRVIRHYGRQVFDKWVKSSRACELSMRERISAPINCALNLSRQAGPAEERAVRPPSSTNSAAQRSRFRELRTRRGEAVRKILAADRAIINARWSRPAH